MPDPNCKTCGGVGLYRKDVPVGNPDFGKLFPCTCVEFEHLPRYKRSGLHESEYTLTWEDVLKLDDIGKGIEAVKQCLARGYGMVYLWGLWGNGKTHLLKVAVAITLSQAMDAAYVNTSDLVEASREAMFDPDGDDKRHRLSYWSTCPVLCLDEFDKVRSTEFAAEKRFRLLDERYVMATRKQNVTIIASNTDPKEFTGEIHSRLNDGRVEVVHLNGADARPGMEYEPDDPLADDRRSAFDTGEKHE